MLMLYGMINEQRINNILKCVNNNIIAFYILLGETFHAGGRVLNERGLCLGQKRPFKSQSLLHCYAVESKNGIGRK